MSANILTLRGARTATPNWRVPGPTAARLAFVLYLAIGAYLAFVLHAYHGDAYSRVANAYYVLFSRDPHLAAIGFVWTPLPSLFELALLPVKMVWPALASVGFAAVLMSATFMSLAVREVDLTLQDFGLGRRARLALVAAFALHPAIVYYGAIGTSEAPMLFFAILGCRHLAGYVVSASTRSLVGVGIALAGAFLTRYEAVAAAVGVAGAIMLLGLLRQPGATRHRMARASADLIVALTPFVVVFVGWSLASWVIVGSPFTQFTSDYGNSSQMRVWAAAGLNEIGLPLGPSVELAALRLGALSIAAPVAIIAALYMLVARREYRVLAVAAVLGPTLAFMVLAYVLHVLAPWLRYFLVVIPLGILLIGLAIAPVARWVVPAHPGRLGGSRLAAGAALALAMISVPVATVGMLNRTVAVEESKDIGALLGPERDAPGRPGAAVRTFAGEQAVAEYLDAMNLPRGAVLMDVFSAFPIVLLSDHPDQFVITTDRDFKPALADPITFGVTYLLAPSVDGNGVLDAVNRAYPSLAGETGFATIAHTFPAIGTSATWNLYRLAGTP
jgi:hypothetical protein